MLITSVPKPSPVSGQYLTWENLRRSLEPYLSKDTTEMTRTEQGEMVKTFVLKFKGISSSQIDKILREFTYENTFHLSVEGGIVKLVVWTPVK